MARPTSPTLLPDASCLHLVRLEADEQFILAVVGTCAGYLEHLSADLDVLHFVERAFLSKYTIGPYNHDGSESIVVLSTLIKEKFLWRFVWSSPSCNEFASAFTRSKNVSCVGSNYRRPHLC
jgi:hypothetical protein